MRNIRNWLQSVLSRILLIIGRIASRVLLRVQVVGSEHVPHHEPLIVIANHFSWFDAPLLVLSLPVPPAVLVASESQRFWFVRLFMRAFHGIPIRRGHVDRNALEAALVRLRQGKPIGIFPEGGIDPRFAEQRERGVTITDTYGHTSRADAQLTYPQPGTAYLAVQSKARILPVGLIGTEQILGNMLQLRRTNVTIHIGPVFGPLDLDPAMDRNEQRKYLEALAEQCMYRVAVLFPPENRGPYRTLPVETPA